MIIGNMELSRSALYFRIFLLSQLLLWIGLLLLAWWIGGLVL